jgi:hypothetical protein
LTTQPNRRPQLSRVPPHDLTLQSNLLGAAMLDAGPARVVASLDPDIFYGTAHPLIAATISELVANDQHPDSGTVGAHLRASGHLEAVGGYPALSAMVNDTPTTRSGEQWAFLLEEMASQRHQLRLASEVVEAIYRGVATTGLVAEMHQVAIDLDRIGISSWEPVNLAAVLAGEGPDATPCALARSDGVKLFYAGKIHAINSEPEAGKSWVALHACEQQMAAGYHTVYVDWEADAADVVGRLLSMGVSPATVVEQFHYVRPHDLLDHAATARLTTLCDIYKPTLVVLDGVTEAMSSAGMSIKENDDIARFYTALPRPLARTGAAVVMLDHVVKDKETQGRWGIGGQHKLAGVDGATYKLESVVPFARDKPGSSKLIVSKDRHGMVRQHATAGHFQMIAMVSFHATDGAMTVTLDPPGANGAGRPFRPTQVMQKVSETVAAAPSGCMSKRSIRVAVGGKHDVVDLAIEHLLAASYLRQSKTGLEHLMPFLADDPDGDRFLEERPDDTY